MICEGLGMTQRHCFSCLPRCLSPAFSFLFPSLSSCLLPSAFLSPLATFCPFILLFLSFSSFLLVLSSCTKERLQEASRSFWIHQYNDVFDSRDSYLFALCLFHFLILPPLLLSYDSPHSLSVEEQQKKSWPNDSEHYVHHKSISHFLFLIPFLRFFLCRCLPSFPFSLSLFSVMILFTTYPWRSSKPCIMLSMNRPRVQWSWWVEWMPSSMSGCLKEWRFKQMKELTK